MTEIATAYISVIPEVNKAIQQAYSETEKGGRRLGEALGGGLSSGAGSGLDALRAKVQATAGAVQKATRDMAAAQKAEADATGALRVAAEKLNETRDNGKAKASQLAAAEESLAKAQRNVEAASAKTSAAVNTHQGALTRAKDATDKFSDAQDGAGKKTKTVSGIFQKSSRDIGDHAGSIGGFADKVKGYIGVMAGVAAGAALGGMFKDMVSEARESQKVTAITAQIIKSTGGTAKVTADQIGALANAISNKTGVDDEAIQTSSNLLLTFKNVANQAGAGANIFDRATAAAVDLSKAGFGDMDSAAKMLGKALNDPVKGLTALGKAGVTFTDQQKEQIKAMVKSGDVLGAQKIIMTEIESQVGGVAAASATAGEKAATTWKNFQEELGNKLLPILDTVAAWFTETAVPALSIAGKAVEGFFHLIVGGDFTGSLSETLGIQEDSGLVDNILTIRETVIGLFDSIKSNLSTVLAFGAALAAIMVSFAIGSALMPIWNAGVALHGTLSAVAAGETTLWATAQNLLNKAFLNNPIGWILIAIIALVAGVIWAWNNFETFRNVVTAVWEGIKTAVGAVVDWFQTTVWPVLQQVFTFIGDKVTWLWENIIRPTFTVISAIVGAFVWYIQNIFWPIIQIAFTIIGRIISAWWETVVKPVFTALKAFFENVIAPVFGWLWHNVIEPFVDGIADKFRTGVAIIGAIWDGLKALAKAPIDFIVRTVINDGLIKGINTIAEFLHIQDSVHANPIPWPPAGWAGGGWTGPGGKWDPAGVVHADEFVVKKSSRRSIEGAVPGFLDALNMWGARALGYASGGRVRPVPGPWTTYAGHTGIDFPVPTGTPVHAAEAGTVSATNWWDYSYGNHIREALESGGEAIYAHLSRIMVAVGQQLAAGDIIGASGSTGNSTGPHLHFEVTGGVDEAAWLSGAESGSGGVLSFLKDRVVNFFRDNINSLLDRIPGAGGLFRDIGVAGAKKAIDGVADFLIGKAEARDSASNPAVGNASNQAIAQAMLGAYGWGADQMGPLSLLWQGESGWNEKAKNPSSGAYGIPQSLPASKMASAGADWMTNPATQIRWGLGYIQSVYGSPSGAYAKWASRSPHWYAEGGKVEPLLLDAGGIIPRGVSFVENRTGAPEALYRGGNGMPSTVVLQVGDREFTGYLREEIGRPAQMAAAGRRTV